MTDLSRLADVYSTATLAKAEKLIETEGVARDDNYLDVFWARGSAGNRYRVQVIEPFDEDEVIGDLPEDAEVLPFVTCTCPNGLATGGRARCYHGAAVVALMMGMDDSSLDPDDA